MTIIFLVNNFFVSLQLLVMFCSFGFIFDSNEYVIIDLNPDVNVFPLTTHVNLFNVQIIVLG